MTSTKRSPNKKLKVLFLVPYPSEGASNRIRIEQYVPYLSSAEMICKIRPFVNSHFYRILYLPHHYGAKTFWFAICTLNRLFDVIRAMRYDVICIHREAYPFGGPVIEEILRCMGKPLVFDFDDSIFLPNTSRHNIYIERFKRPDKVARIIALSRVVVAGNEYLKRYALQYNKNVTIIPSAVDTEKYTPCRVGGSRERVVIGWIGSSTTRDFLYGMKDVFGALSRRYPAITFKIIGDGVYGLDIPNVINKKWSLRDEIDDLRELDIGIMPMPDNEWTKGKCGFKNILYMSLGLPVVCSPVGVNVEIVQDGITGYLARTPEEWIDRLSRLIHDRAARERMGAAGRERARRYYSVEVNAPKIAAVMHQAGDRACAG